MQHQQNLYLVFIYFKKTFDRLWHESLWATLWKFTSMPASFESLKICMTMPRMHSCSIAAQDYSKSPTRVSTFFNIFLERIICEALDDHESSVSIGLPFRFADDIVVNAEEEEEAGVLVDRHDTTTTTKYQMEIGPDNTKVMINNPNVFQREIKIKGHRLEAVENFK